MIWEQLSARDPKSYCKSSHNAVICNRPKMFLAELSKREPIFHRAEFGTTRADFEGMTEDDFWEVGASGRIYPRSWVLDELDKRRAAAVSEVWQTSNLQCRQLAPDVYLITYTLLQDRTRLTRRSTIWRHTSEGWKIVYHQGTIVQGE